MNLLSMMLLSAVLVIAAVYAQSQIPRYTATRKNIVLTRTVLIAVGIACGAVSASIYATDTATALLAFLAGFGAVHVPAAFILLIKRGRGAGPT
jgi:hypothetical protein